MLNKNIERLLKFSLEKNLVDPEDLIISRNLLLSLLGAEEPYYENIEKEDLDSPNDILEDILNGAFENGILKENNTTHRDLLSAKIMGIVTPRQSEICNKFYELYNESPALATDYFYKLCINNNYIQKARTDKNIFWKEEVEFGALELTINLSKPEKDPKEIAAAKNIQSKSYPKCLLCIENVGYEGRLDFPARQNHRAVKLMLDEKYYLQYSPYLYYNEHCIVLNEKHIPMKIDKQIFQRLMDFIGIFPHYFLGSNADLPIVGGSILSHDHFQGGRYNFPMEFAKKIQLYKHEKFPDVNISIVNWPLSTVRVSSENVNDLVEITDYIFLNWKEYSDEEREILAYTDTRHNTVTPIARKNADGIYEMDVVLRNNRTSEEHPLGIFHPHADLHHIKKENIGLIEVMGLAILPARIKDESQEIKQILMGEKYIPQEKELLDKHDSWIKFLIEKYGQNNDENTAEIILKKEIGDKFKRVLEDSGVFKLDENGLNGFKKFMKELKFIEIN